MRMLAFASRNGKEIARDPISLLFGIGLPLALLAFFSTLAKSLPVDTFRVENFTPGMAVFGLSFISLFSGMLIAKDRSSSFLMRLFASPLSATDYLWGYSLPILPIAVVQGAACFLAAILLGLPVSLNLLVVLLLMIPIGALFVGFGLLLGSLLTDKQVGGIGSILVNLATIMGGAWFSLDLVGGPFRTIGYALPFAHAVDATRLALAGDWAAILPHLWWVVGYAAIIFAVAVLIFRRQMRAGHV